MAGCGGGPNGILMSEHMGVGYGTTPLDPVRCGKAFHDVDTTPPRMPDRLWNPVSSWCDTPPITMSPPPVSPSRMRSSERPLAIASLEPMYLRPDLSSIIERHGRFDDEPIQLAMIDYEAHVLRREEGKRLALVEHWKYMREVFGV